MKNYLLILILLSACKPGSQKAGSGQDSSKQRKERAEVPLMLWHSGNWTYEKKLKDVLVSTFKLHLVVRGNQLTGNFCSIAPSGKRIDCTEDSLTNNVSGTITNNVASVTLTGNYDTKASAQAKLYLTGRNLNWELSSLKGDMFLPERAVLTPELNTKETKDAMNKLPISGSDLAKLPFKEVREQIIGLDDFYCGMYPKAYECPMVGKYQVKIMSNECGDFPFYSLVTTFRGRFVDKKMIFMKQWINGENENEKSTTDFKITNDYKINVSEQRTLNGSISNDVSVYSIDESSGLIKKVNL